MRSLTFTLLFQFAAATCCWCQSHFALGAGPSVPIGDLGDGSTLGLHAIGMLSFDFDRRTISWRLDASYSHFYAYSPPLNSSTDVLGISGSAVVAPHPGRRTRPYFTLGLSIERAPGYCPDPNAAGFAGGFGVRINRVVVESRFHLVGTGCNTLFHIPLTLAVSW